MSHMLCPPNHSDCSQTQTRRLDSYRAQFSFHHALSHRPRRAPVASAGELALRDHAARAAFAARAADEATAAHSLSLLSRSSLLRRIHHFSLVVLLVLVALFALFALVLGLLGGFLLVHLGGLLGGGQGV